MVHLDKEKSSGKKSKEMILNVSPCASSRPSFLYLVHEKSSPFSLRFYFPSSRTASPPLFFSLFFPPLAQTIVLKMLNLQFWVCYQMKQFYLTSCFCQNIFKAAGELSDHSDSQLRFLLAFPQVFPAQHLVTGYYLRRRGKKLLHETVCRFKNCPLGTEGQRSKVLGCQTPGLGDHVSFLDEAFSEET